MYELNPENCQDPTLISSCSLVLFKARSQANSREFQRLIGRNICLIPMIIEKLMRELRILNKNNNQEALRAVNNKP